MVPVASVSENHKDCAASLGLHDTVDLVACCLCQCCHASLSSRCGAVSSGISRGWRALRCFGGCSLVLYNSCTCVTCVAAYCLQGDVYHCIVLHRELQTVATMVTLVYIDQAGKL